MDLKSRIGLLRIFAEIDEPYQQAQSELDEAICALAFQELSKEQLQEVRRLMLAYASVNERLLELACERMVFAGEVKKK